MKKPVGVILAGGRGIRLAPITQVVNKHLLPVYDRPMVCYPLAALVEAGIDEVVIVTNGGDIGDFQDVLGDNVSGLRQLTFAKQLRAGGIADALLSAEEAVAGRPACVILGDNVCGGSLAPAARQFALDPVGALLMLAEVDDVRGLGVARFDGPLIAGEPLPAVVEIVEKPDAPPSRHAVVGVYFYGADVFNVCRGVTPSARGELEITAVNNVYLERGAARFEVLDGWWADAGTFEGLRRASMLVAGDRKAGSRIGLSPVSA